MSDYPNIDLHMHTNLSDGLLTPTELLAKVRASGIVAFSVTDHDTLAGYREVNRLLESDDPELITGTELSVDMGERDMHLLAYLFDPDNETFVTALDEFQKARNRRGARMVQKLRDLGLNITYDAVEEVAAGAVVGRPHIAETLHRLNQVATYEEAFRLYIHNDGPAYVPKAKLSPEEALQLVHQAGGVAVMAHPFLNDMHVYIERLAGLGLDGIEVYHYTHTPPQAERLKHLADRHRLLQSGGSDFHGRSDRSAEIGSQNVPARLLEGLKQRAEQIRRQHS